MATYERSERDLVAAFTGLVVESLHVTQDVGSSSVACGVCGDPGAAAASTPAAARLGVGDDVTVALSCYEGHSWEINGLYCGRHGLDSVAETMAVRAEDQAVVRAVLEPAGYHGPDGRYHPDALTLGQVDVLEYSSTADGY
jgi:hypothetical protein